MDVLNFSCPRCRRPASGRYYGPCDDCRCDLRASLGGTGRAVQVQDYEPKMNVTPNQVATKD